MGSNRTASPRASRSQFDNRWSGQRGQSGVEFGLLAPVLFVLVLGVGGLAPAFNADVSLQNAAREGVRHGVWWNSSTSSNPYADSNDIRSAVQDSFQCSGCVQLQPASGQTCPIPNPVPDAAYPTAAGQIWMYVCFNNDPTATTATKGQPIGVLITETWQTFVPLPGGGNTLKLHAAITMMTQGT